MYSYTLEHLTSYPSVCARFTIHSLIQNFTEHLLNIYCVLDPVQIGELRCPHDKSMIKAWSLPSRSLQLVEDKRHFPKEQYITMTHWDLGSGWVGGTETLCFALSQDCLSWALWLRACSRSGGKGGTAPGDSCYFGKPPVIRKVFSQIIGQSFCCLLSRCCPNSPKSSIWGHSNGARRRVNACACVCKRMHTHAGTPSGMPRLLWDFSRAHFPSTDSGEGLAETVGGDKIAE